MPETELSDSELIKAFGEGDHAAFETLYHRYRRQLYGFLSNLIPGNPAEVDEVFEETWLRVIDKLPKYRDDGKFSAWLFRVSRNLFIDRVRRNRPPGNGCGGSAGNRRPRVDVAGAGAGFRRSGAGDRRRRRQAAAGTARGLSAAAAGVAFPGHRGDSAVFDQHRPRTDAICDQKFTEIDPGS